MDQEDILQQLQELAEKLSIEVRFEKGDFEGGLYRYKDDEKIVLNNNLSTETKIKIMAKELKSRLDFEHLYLVPAIREVIEDASSMER